MNRKKKLDALTYDDFRRQVKEGRIESLYLFTGEEEYLHERAVRMLYNSVDEASRVFNVAIFSVGSDISPGGPKATASMAIDVANQWPMMASRRIVIIRDFDKIREEEADLVFDYLKRPASTATVVFQSPSLDQRRKITTALMKACVVVSFDRLSDQQAARWAEQFLKLRNCRIEPTALGHLIGLAGARMSRLANELEKLAAYAEGSIINNAIVEQLVPRAREHSGFELWDAVMDRDRKRALRLLDRMLDDGAEPVVVVGSIAGLYRRMLAGKELIARQASSEEVMKATGQYGLRAKHFNMRINRASREELVRGLRRIAQVDDAIKSSISTPRLQLEILICELTLPESAHWSIFQNQR